MKERAVWDEKAGVPEGMKSQRPRRRRYSASKNDDNNDNVQVKVHHHHLKSPSLFLSMKKSWIYIIILLFAHNENNNNIGLYSNAFSSTTINKQKNKNIVPNAVITSSNKLKQMQETRKVPLFFQQRQQSASASSGWQLEASSSSSSSERILYEEPVFRPPAEWQSLILQVTIGCSWNKCTFCEMYQNKKYRYKSLQEVEQDLQHFAAAANADDEPADATRYNPLLLQLQPLPRDVFLADGDAMTLPTKHLLGILQLIHLYFPNIRRISSYCLPRNIQYKTVEELTLLRQAGLSLVYIGCESGNNKVLQAVQKGETFDSSLDALIKLQKAGIKRSVMILLGLGGKVYSNDHAIDSALLVSKAAPEFLSVLTTSFPRGLDRIQEGYSTAIAPAANIATTDANTTNTTKESLQQQQSSSLLSFFQPLTPREGLEELRLFLNNIEITTNRTIFRSDHASNYLVLKGRLGRDKSKLLYQLDTVLMAPPEQDRFNLRPEWARGL